MKPETKRYFIIGGVAALLAILLDLLNTYTEQYIGGETAFQIIGFAFLYDFITIGALLSIAVVIGNSITKEPYADAFSSSVLSFFIVFVGLLMYYFFTFVYPGSFLTTSIGSTAMVVLFSVVYVMLDN